jgi:hypothetical protein
MSRAFVDTAGVSLGSRVATQRLVHVGKKQGRLDPERARRLEALTGWTWNCISRLRRSGFARSYLMNDEFANHERSVARRMRLREGPDARRAGALKA